MVSCGLRRLAGGGGRGKWSPYTLHGQTGLAEMVSALKTVPDTKDTQTRGKTLKESTPESPAERRFRKKPQPFKAQPLPEHEARYANNPWAQMLASSTRLCQGSRIRFPTALMTDYTLHTDEDGSENYLLPADLADLPKFKAALSSDDPVTAIINRKYTGNAGQNIRVLSYDFLLQTMTDKFQVWDSKTQTSATRLKSVAERLAPPRWSMVAQKMRSYRRASKEYHEEVQARKAEGQPGFEDYTEEREPVNLLALHWKPDMVQRIANAMRMRILIALDEALRRDTTQQIVQINIPERPEIQISNSVSSTQEFWNDMGDIEVPSALSASSNRQGKPSDPRPPIAVRPDEISQDLPTPYPPPGSIILHTGSPQQFQITLEKWHLQEDSPSPPANAYIPPTLLTNTTPLPIFNIQSLLTPSLQRELSQILSEHSPSNQPLPNPTSDPPPAPKPQSESLLLIPATSPVTAALTHEIYQLWRFQGGTTGLQASLDAAESVGISAVQKEHLRGVMGWRKAYGSTERMINI